MTGKAVEFLYQLKVGPSHAIITGVTSMSDALKRSVILALISMPNRVSDFRV